jgi:ABC-type uncharacterized transport system permease subunit
MRLELVPRPDVPGYARVLAPVAAVIVAILIGGIIVALMGRSPAQALDVYFIQPLTEGWSQEAIAVKATPLLIIAVGLSFCFRAGLWNIGAEGQFIIGALVGSMVPLATHGTEAGSWVLPVALAMGALGGLLYAHIPALLRVAFGVSEILTSLMLVYIAQLVVSWLVHGPWMDPEGFNFPQTKQFQAHALLPILLKGTRLNAAFLLGIGALIVGWVFMNRSFLGYQMKVAGQAENAGRYAGFSAKRTIWFGMLAGGCMAGIAGLGEVAGPIGQITEHISPGYGFAAMIVAFLGRLNPIGIFFSSLLMSLLYLGGEQAQQYLNLPSSISKVFQGLLLFFLLGSDVFVYFRPQFGKRKK